MGGIFSPSNYSTALNKLIAPLSVLNLILLEVLWFPSVTSTLLHNLLLPKSVTDGLLSHTRLAAASSQKASLNVRGVAE